MGGWVSRLSVCVHVVQVWGVECGCGCVWVGVCVCGWVGVCVQACGV